MISEVIRIKEKVKGNEISKPMDIDFDGFGFIRINTKEHTINILKSPDVDNLENEYLIEIFAKKEK